MAAERSGLICPKGPLDERLDQLLRQFWEVETDPIVKASKEELDCESHFVKNFVRLEGGAFTVRLPIKHNNGLLGDSHSQALRRFQSLERKLFHQPELRTQYSAFIKEYLNLGHMSLVPPELHRDCKYIRPLTGDICKMYRCVRMASSDSFLQCILWRDSPLEELQTYKLDTVTYGTKPASYLSVRAMYQLAKDEVEDFPVGSEILLRDFYVDDLISGGSSKEEVVGILALISAFLSKGEFQLRQWWSNISSVLAGSTSKPSRRSVLSSIARLYDLLGLAGPVVTKAKIFLQKLCREHHSWDESLPQDKRSAGA
ncbi:uncharacterized protein LOC123257553 [Drosophila ananassae]|uniref:uncharacterized protein LOC123257553 n=1 Tax=Drosophila ananassae TaxID=7217 RepID=UPI001CFFF20B|nr:uncharacterized protein LOC123257553 [Drosophila ananassae]